MNDDIDTLDELIHTVSAVGRAIDLDKRDIDGDTPLHVATKGAHHKIVETLIKSGADLSKTNHGGLSVLHYLAQLITQNRENAYNYMLVSKQSSLPSHAVCSPD